MDLRSYFRKLREVEGALPDEYPLIVSLGTAEGGKPGVVSEVPRPLAAKMIVEGRASLATDEQVQFFREQQLDSKRAAEKAEMARRVKVAIVSDSDLQSHVTCDKSNGPSTTGK